MESKYHYEYIFLGTIADFDAHVEAYVNRLWGPMHTPSGPGPRPDFFKRVLPEGKIDSEKTPNAKFEFYNYGHGGPEGKGFISALRLPANRTLLLVRTSMYFYGPPKVEPIRDIWRRLESELRKHDLLLACDEAAVSVSVDSTTGKSGTDNTVEIGTGLSSGSTTQKVSTLFLSADPTDASRLRLGEELREIQEKLRLASQRDRFELQQRMSVRVQDISQAMLDTNPQIVHFSGHGHKTGALCFEDPMGKVHPVKPDALAALFSQFADRVKCVVLNACYSKLQAEAVAAHVEHVIGMNAALGDRAAIAFSVGFYQALGAGRTFEEAFNLGCVQIRFQNIPEHLTPVLIRY